MNYSNHQMVKEGPVRNGFSSFFMKKFMIFSGILFLVIVSEYLMVNEFFAQKRPAVLALSILASIFFFIAAYRFFKKYFLSPKQV